MRTFTVRSEKGEGNVLVLTEILRVLPNQKYNLEVRFLSSDDTVVHIPHDKFYIRK